MLKSQTLFVIGAGASNEVGIPVGTGLAEAISKKLDIRFTPVGEITGTGDRQISEALQNITKTEFTQYLHACWLIRDGIPYAYSIDNFLDTHSHNEKITICGKLAIVKAILDAERDSKLYVSREDRGVTDIINARGSWYFELLRFLQNGVNKNNVSDIFNNCSFLVFNYDRCVEHFLHCALQNLYGMSAAEAGVIMGTLNIHHPYGTVGTLPWQSPINDRPPVPFGAQEVAGYLPRLIGGIRTYTERIGDPHEIGLIHEMVNGADTIVFLGFSYLPQNMDLLLRTGRTEKRRRVLGTGIGLSEMDRSLVSNSLSELSRRGGRTLWDPIIEKLHCAELIAQYNRFLLSA